MQNRLSLNSTKLLAAGIIAFSLFSAVGCESYDKDHSHQLSQNDPHNIRSAVAVIVPTAGNRAHGWVRFQAEEGGLRVTAEIEGLSPNSDHGFHIHEYGDCTQLDGKSAGGHYNPEGNPHALPDHEPRHAGDLGNIHADAAGVGHYDAVFTNISIAGPHNAILGRGIIIHAKPDDGGQPTGNAGARLACGVIGIANPG